MKTITEAVFCRNATIQLNIVTATEVEGVKLLCVMYSHSYK